MKPLTKQEVIERLISLLGFGISLSTILEICFETGAESGAEEAAGCGSFDLRKSFEDRIDLIMKSRRLQDIYIPDSTT